MSDLQDLTRRRNGLKFNFYGAIGLLVRLRGTLLIPPDDIVKINQALDLLSQVDKNWDAGYLRLKTEEELSNMMKRGSYNA